MTDSLTKIGRSLIQHGPDNDRIYLMKLHPADLPALPAALDQLADKKGYSKIFAKVPEPCAQAFEPLGYRKEGAIPGFYDGKETAVFLGKFFDEQRATSPDLDRIREILAIARRKADSMLRPLSHAYTLRAADTTDSEALAKLYGDIFDSYPFPIHDPDYVLQTMRSNVCYFVAEHSGRIVAAASGEMDREARNAEMTDFATRVDHRGMGLAEHLLRRLQPVMLDQNIATLYTIARAVSPAMNITFARCGYSYGGTLINNTQISGQIESMNLWFKPSRC